MFTNELDRRSRLLAVAAVALVAIACGTPQPTNSPAPSHSPTNAPSATPSTAPTVAPTSSPTPPPSSTPAPTRTPAGASLLLEVTTEGGFIAPSAHLGELATVVVDTAGDIYTPDPNFSGTSLIPPVVVRNVGPNGAAQILAAMRTAGLDKEGSSGGQGNPDAGVTVFTAEIDGQEIVNRVVAGGPGHPGSSPQPALDLLSRLQDASESWGATDSQPTAFTPTAYKVYVAPSTDGGTTAAWPLSTSLAEFGTPATPDFGVTGLRTGAVTGQDATDLGAALASVQGGTLLTSGGQVFQVWIRPLLPPEIS